MFEHIDDSPCSDPFECEKRGGPGIEDHWCKGCGERATKCPTAFGEDHDYGDIR